MPNPFTLPGEFLKGNLHLHTCKSDGALSPQAAADYYCKKGYDFVAITDHDALAHVADLDAGDLIVLPGDEVSAAPKARDQSRHVVGIGMAEKVDRDLCLQKAIAEVADKASIVFIAHPRCSGMTAEELARCGGFIGIEVYNVRCQLHPRKGQTGCSAKLWDRLLAQGKRLWGFAVDDAHLKKHLKAPRKPEHFDDSLGAWIMVKARERSADAIYEALEAGSFYSSTGPELTDVTVRDDKVSVSCSLCKAVHVIRMEAGRRTTTTRTAPDGRRRRRFDIDVEPGWDVIRAECVDTDGMKAWTNPFWPDT